jgi:hypothetical protein
MGELEDQIARLAQHRADQVPPYRAPASLSTARGRHRAAWFVAAAAIVTAIAVVAGAVLWDRGDDPSVRTGPSPATELPAPSTVPPTTPPTTTPSPRACPVEQVDTNPMSGGPAGRTEDAALAYVHIQTSACVDEVAFRFRGSPDWTVEYRSGPILLEPSDQLVDIEGAAFLVVRFDHSDAGRAGYTGPQQLFAGSLSHVTEVRQTQDFEAVLTWVIGLDSRVPFGVEERRNGGDTSVVVRFPEPGEERAVRCSLPEDHAEFFVPSGWYTELNEDVQCHFFAPEPFRIVRNSDARVPVMLSVGAGSIANELRGGTAVSTPVQTADDHRGECFEDENKAGGRFPAGTRFFACIVGWADGQFLTVSTNGYSGAEFETNKAGVQAIVTTARYLP